MKKPITFSLATSLATLVLTLTASSFVFANEKAAPVADMANGKTKAETVCAACHGADGNSTNTLWPKLAGQHPSYIEKQLKDFINDERSDPAMTAMAKPLTEQEIKDVSAYFGAQTATTGTADETKAQAGMAIFKGGKMTTGVTACAACHGPTGDGNPAARYPRIAGQHTDYLVKTLTDFRTKTRTNSPANIMGDIAKRMSDEDILAVSEYISGLRN